MQWDPPSKSSTVYDFYLYKVINLLFIVRKQNGVYLREENKLGCLLMNVF